MATPPQLLLACPYCGAPIEAQRERCSGCDVPLLYGLVAAAQSDPRLQDRAAAVLAAVPGGPGLPEGRRRVREGLPLIVGLSRTRTEELQGRLVDVGLVPRIGPAPRGTPPLEPERAHRSLVGRVALALAIPLLALALFRLLEPEPPVPEPPRAATAAQGSDEAGGAPALELSAGFERERHGHLWLVLSARVRGEGPLPGADLVVRLRDETGTVIWTGSLPPQGAYDREIHVSGGGTLVQRTLNGRLSLGDVFLEGGERLTLEGNWQGRESERLAVEVPPPFAPR